MRLCMAAAASSPLRTGGPHSLRLERLGQEPDDYGEVLALVVRREDDRVLVAGYPASEAGRRCAVRGTGSLT
jgi:hypothetical protein